MHDGIHIIVIVIAQKIYSLIYSSSRNMITKVAMTVHFL